ncbi:hypothetical protein GCM10009646_70420 [Streptomyces aureus]
MPFTGMEATRSRQIEHPLVIPRATYQPLVLASLFHAQHALQQPLLRRPELVPPQTLRLDPCSEAFTLHDQNTRLTGERAGGVEMVLGYRKGLGFAGA